MKFKDVCMPEFNAALQPLYQSKHLSSADWLLIADVIASLKKTLEPFQARVKQLQDDFKGEELEAKFKELVECDCEELPKLEYSLVEKAQGVSLVDIKLLSPILSNVPEKIVALLG